MNKCCCIVRITLENMSLGLKMGYTYLYPGDFLSPEGIPLVPRGFNTECIIVDVHRYCYTCRRLMEEEKKVQVRGFDLRYTRMLKLRNSCKSARMRFHSEYVICVSKCRKKIY